VQSEYARNYRQLYQNHWWWRSRESYILRILRRCQQQEGDQVEREILDVGCGDGLFFPVLEQFGNVQGVESDPQIVDSNGCFADQITIGKFNDTYRPVQSFDWITLLDVIEHIPAECEPLRRAGELLAAEGKMFITVPAFNLLWTKHDEFNQHQTRYTRRLLRQQIDAAGLKLLRMQYLFHWTFPVKLLIRLKETVFRSRPRCAQIPPAAINASCKALCQLEQRIITPLRPPFGSSLLAVATKQ